MTIFFAHFHENSPFQPIGYTGSVCAKRYLKKGTEIQRHKGTEERSRHLAEAVYGKIKC